MSAVAGIGLHGPTIFGPAWAIAISVKLSPAWPGLARLQPTLNTISLQDVVLEVSGRMPETETHRQNSNIIYTLQSANFRTV